MYIVFADILNKFYIRAEFSNLCVMANGEYIRHPREFLPLVTQECDYCSTCACCQHSIFISIYPPTAASSVKVADNGV